ncbi:MAG: Rieske 2Fe-2S domain-containing protein [Candidatus Limnocylindrales bacterium]
MSTPRLLPFPPDLQAAGTAGAPFQVAVALADLPLGSMLRLTRGDLDVLIAHTEAGLVATDDRCPHMSAPFSAGRLDGCTLHCPLHRGAFDVRDGEVVTFPTTGGLTADGEYRPTWSPDGKVPPPPPSDSKAQARALTRVRRLRYYPLRVRDGLLEVALPA